eukprot:22174-Pelagomonas_calceolata.AAC.1
MTDFTQDMNMVVTSSVTPQFCVPILQLYTQGRIQQSRFYADVTLMRLGSAFLAGACLGLQEQQQT